MRRVECALSSRVVREPYPHTVWSYRLECQHLADSDTEGRSHVACPVCLVDDRAPPPVSEIANRGVGAGSRVSENPTK
jgi:hypothetical protein